MPRPLHDQTASVVALARNLHMGLDRTSERTSVSTNSLELILLTFIALAARKSVDMRETIQVQETVTRLDAIKKMREEIEKKNEIMRQDAEAARQRLEEEAE